MVSMNLDCAIGDEWCGSLSRRERHVLMGRLRGRVIIRTRRRMGGWVDGSEVCCWAGGIDICAEPRVSSLASQRCSVGLQETLESQRGLG